MGAEDRPGCSDGAPYDPLVDLSQEAGRLRREAVARPLKLPANRRLDERHRALGGDGLEVWYTIQLSPRHRIHEVLFRRRPGRPGDDEVRAWLDALLPGLAPVEAAGPPGAELRRFEVFE